MHPLFGKVKGAKVGCNEAEFRRVFQAYKIKQFADQSEDFTNSFFEKLSYRKDEVQYPVRLSVEDFKYLDAIPLGIGAMFTKEDVMSKWFIYFDGSKVAFPKQIVTDMLIWFEKNCVQRTKIESGNLYITKWEGMYTTYTLEVEWHSERHRDNMLRLTEQVL